jgi:hypothetical protein
VRADSAIAEYGHPGAAWALLGPDVVLRRTAYDASTAFAAISASAGDLPGIEFIIGNVRAAPAAPKHWPRSTRPSSTRPGNGRTRRDPVEKRLTAEAQNACSLIANPGRMKSTDLRGIVRLGTGLARGAKAAPVQSAQIQPNGSAQ